MRRIGSGWFFRMSWVLFLLVGMVLPVETGAHEMGAPGCAGAGPTGSLQTSFPLSPEGFRLGEWSLKVDAQLRGLWENRPVVSGVPQEKRGDTLFVGYLNAQKNLLGMVPSLNCTTQNSNLYRFCHSLREPKDQAALHQAWFGGRTDADLSSLTWNLLAPVTIAPEDIPILRTFERFMEAKDFGELRKIAASNPDRLSDEQFLGLVSMWGASMASQYDHDRADQKNGREKGIVTEEQLFQAAKWNLVNHAWWGESGPNAPQKAGVCRDIAVAQASLFDARHGKGSSFVLSLSTVGGGHSMVVARNPKHPQEIVHLNYGRIVRNSGREGARALFLSQKGFGDVTPSAYGLYDSTGAPVSKVPSELGKALQESMGLSPEWMDPLARPSSSLVRVGAEARSDRWVPSLTLGANAVSGQTAVGQTFSGGGVMVRVKPSNRSSSELFAEGIFVDRTPDAGETDQSKGLSGGMGAIAVAQKNTLLSRELPEQRLKLRLETEVTSQVSAYRFVADRKTGIDVNASGKIQVSVEKDAEKASLDEVLWKARMGLILVPAYRDVRLLNGAFQPTEMTLIPNSVFVEGKFMKRLSLLSAVELEGLMSLDGLGARARVRALYRGATCRVGANWSGRLWSNSDAEAARYLQESSFQRVGVEGGCQLTPGVNWDASLDTAIEVSDSTRLMTGVGGNF